MSPKDQSDTGRDIPPEVLEGLLATCASEPIHRPGAVQPWGALVVVNAQSRVVAAANTAAILGQAPETILGADWSAVAAGLGVAGLRFHTQPRFPHVSIPRVAALSTGSTVLVDRFEAAGRVLYEFEQPPCDPEPDIDNAEVMLALHGCTSVGDAAARATRLLSDISGFHRCMLYEFDPDWCGTVIAEAVAGGGPTRFIDHRFPASDIPEQARRLYTASVMRIIPDVAAPTCPLVTDGTLLSGAIDIGPALTRAVSPVHLQYLRNMEVQATMVLSILVEGRLWGMLVCQHPTPYRPPAAVRLFAQHLACALGPVIAFLRLQHETNRQRAITPVFETLRRGGAGAVATNLRTLAGHLQMLMNADGFAFRIGGADYASGVFTSVPRHLPRREGADPMEVLSVAASDTAIDTGDWPPTVVGALVIPLDVDRRDVLLFGRRDQVEPVRWAGEPNKTITVDPSGVPRLSPRGSFEAWIEVKRGRARPFDAIELGFAETLQTLIGRLIAHHALTEELARRRDVERLLTEEERRKQQFLDLSGIRFWEARSSGRITFLGGNTWSLPWLADKDLDRLIVDVLTRDILQPVQAGEIRRLFSSRAAFSDVTISLVDPLSGAPHTLVLGAVPQYSAAGAFLGWRGVAANVTDQVNQQVRAAELDAVVAAKNRLVASVSHDLRQPLQAMTLFASLAAARATDPDLADLIARIETQSNALSSLVNALLDVGRIDDDLVRPVMAVVDLTEMLHRVVREYRDTQKGKPIAIRCVLQPARAITDAGLVERLFRNLIQNAVKFATPGRVLVGIRRRSGRQVIEVMDDGPGIAPEHHEEVFSAWRSRQTLPIQGPEGMGLGLATVRRIADVLGITIQLRSRPGQGTRFTLTFPADATSAALN
ncbi:MAG: ATP-binding protein [Alphaproteobacteria bacterium]|nr:ATP-binding protein [Alphaproteobacteria bacterium]